MIPRSKCTILYCSYNRIMLLATAFRTRAWIRASHCRNLQQNVSGRPRDEGHVTRPKSTYVAYVACVSLLLCALADCAAPIPKSAVLVRRDDAPSTVFRAHEREDGVLGGGVIKRTRVTQKDRGALLLQELERLKKLPRTSR
jgi:hypothetical protein